MNIPKTDDEKFELVQAKSLSRDIKAICRLHFRYLSFTSANSICIGETISAIVSETETMEKNLKLA